VSARLTASSSPRARIDEIGTPSTCPGAIGETMTQSDCSTSYWHSYSCWSHGRGKGAVSMTLQVSHPRPSSVASSGLDSGFVLRVPDEHLPADARPAMIQNHHQHLHDDNDAASRRARSVSPARPSASSTDPGPHSEPTSVALQQPGPVASLPPPAPPVPPGPSRKRRKSTTDGSHVPAALGAAAAAAAVAAGAAGVSKGSPRVWGRAFRTSGDVVLLIGLVCTALYAAIFALVMSL
jgi:hypothetical protein